MWGYRHIKTHLKRVPCACPKEEFSKLLELSLLLISDRVEVPWVLKEGMEM